MPPLEPYIDAHSHIWTPDLAKYPLAEGFTVEGMKPASFTAEQLLAHCRPAGVGRVNLIQMSFYGLDNSYMLDMIKLYPDRFVGTAIVDPFGADPAAAMRALRPQGVRAFRILSVGPYGKTAAAQRNFEANPPALAPRGGIRRDVRRGGEIGQALSCLIAPDAFPEVDRMCQAFPETTVILDHLGRVGIDGQIRDADVAALCAWRNTRSSS